MGNVVGTIFFPEKYYRSRSACCIPKSGFWIPYWEYNPRFNGIPDKLDWKLILGERPNLVFDLNDLQDRCIKMLFWISLL